MSIRGPSALAGVVTPGQPVRASDPATPVTGATRRASSPCRSSFRSDPDPPQAA